MNNRQRRRSGHGSLISFARGTISSINRCKLKGNFVFFFFFFSISRGKKTRKMFPSSKEFGECVSYVPLSRMDSKHYFDNSGNECFSMNSLVSLNFTFSIVR